MCVCVFVFECGPLFLAAGCCKGDVLDFSLGFRVELRSPFRLDDSWFKLFRVCGLGYGVGFPNSRVLSPRTVNRARMPGQSAS